MTMEFKMTEEEMTFGNEKFFTRIMINGKGEGTDRGEPRLRCSVSIILTVKETEKELPLRANIYWDTFNPKTHVFFSGGSLVKFVEEHGLEYADEFKAYWGQIKRLVSIVFTEKEISEFRKTKMVNI